MSKHITTTQILRRHGVILEIKKWIPTNETLASSHDTNTNLLQDAMEIDDPPDHSSVDTHLVAEPPSPSPSTLSVSDHNLPNQASNYSVSTSAADEEPSSRSTQALELPESLDCASLDDPDVEIKSFRKYFNYSLKKLPSEMQTRQRKKILEKVVLPKIAALNGGADNLFRTLQLTSVLKEAEAGLIRQMESESTQKAQKMLDIGRKQAVKKIAAEYQVTAATVLEGTRQSKSGASDSRSIVALEPVAQAEQRSKLPSRRKAPPSIARTHLSKIIVEMVLNEGGGDKLDIGKGRWRKLLQPLLLWLECKMLAMNASTTPGVSATTTASSPEVTCSTATVPSTSPTAPQVSPTPPSSTAPHGDHYRRRPRKKRRTHRKAVSDVLSPEEAQDLKDWLSEPSNATYLKTLYLERIHLESSQLRIIDDALLGHFSEKEAEEEGEEEGQEEERKSTVDYTKRKVQISVDERVSLLHSLTAESTGWNSIKAKLIEQQLLPDLPDLCYLIREHYRYARGLDLRHRRRVKEIFPGIRMPTTPPVRATTKALKDKLVKDSKDTPLSDEEIMSLIDKRKVFIGHEEEVELDLSKKKNKTLPSTQKYPMRLLDPRVQLISILRPLIDKGLLKPKSKEVEIKYSDWFDGTTALRWSVFTILIGLIFDPTLFSDESHFDEVTRMKPIALGICKETIRSVQKFRVWEGQMIRERVNKVWEYKGISYHFVPYLCKGDHSARSKGGSNQVGGERRCDLCGASWKKAALSELWDLSKMNAKDNFRKSLSAVMELQQLHPSEAQRQGCTRRHPFIPLSCVSAEELLLLNLTQYQIGIDPLHDLSGHSKKVCIIPTEDPALYSL